MCAKLRVVMMEKKLECVFVLEDVSAADTTISEVNPLGKVPCLIMEDGKVLYDSSVIVDYLDTMTPVGKLIPANSRERAETKCWEALADGVLDAAILVRLEETKRPAKQQNPVWIAHQMGKVHTGLKAMAKGLGEKPFCSGNAYSLADIAVGCSLGWLSLRYPQIEWRTDYSNLARLSDKLAERVSFRETMPE